MIYCLFTCRSTFSSNVALEDTPTWNKYGKLLARSLHPSKSIALQALKDKAARSTLTNGWENPPL